MVRSDLAGVVRNKEIALPNDASEFGYRWVPYHTQYKKLGVDVLIQGKMVLLFNGQNLIVHFEDSNLIQI